ncbi:MAG: hypothetical protein LBS93_04360 [Synergistaceae bacterium]|jgi:hypothetical protein|nr:hypothetical protein [Synergistaceae bacterium]
MDYLTVRELRSTPKQVWGKLREQGKLVLTNNGKPVAIMVQVDGTNLDQKINLLEQAETMQIINEMQLESLKNGNCDMSMEEIDAEIALTRAERSQNQ